jgi:AraC-like DNA-binding protein
VTYSPCSIVAVQSVAVQSVPQWRQWSVHPALRHWVLGYWEHWVCAGTQTVRILPDACVDIACDLSHAEAPVVYITGPHSEPATHQVAAPTRLFGARLHPLAAATLIGPHLDGLTNARLPLERFIGRPAVELAERLVSATEAEAVAVFDAFFAERLPGHEVDPRLTRSLDMIFASQGQASVVELACAAGATERTMRRIFERQVGLTPKRLARIVRVQAALRRIERNTDWAKIAAELGYTDQSHLIREMNALLGDSPKVMTERLAPK